MPHGDPAQPLPSQRTMRSKALLQAPPRTAPQTLCLHQPQPPPRAVSAADAWCLPPPGLEAKESRRRPVSQMTEAWTMAFSLKETEHTFCSRRPTECFENTGDLAGGPGRSLVQGLLQRWLQPPAGGCPTRRVGVPCEVGDDAQPGPGGGPARSFPEERGAFEEFQVSWLGRHRKCPQTAFWCHFCPPLHFLCSPSPKNLPESELPTPNPCSLGGPPGPGLRSAPLYPQNPFTPLVSAAPPDSLLNFISLLSPGPSLNCLAFQDPDTLRGSPQSPHTVQDSTPCLSRREVPVVGLALSSCDSCPNFRTSGHTC